MNLFDRDDEIFETERPFREDYEPETLHNRETELKEYASALMPVVKGDPPKNVFLYGNRGVGKTAATNHIIDQLREAITDTDDVSLTVVPIQCRTASTSYQLAIEIINELRTRRNEHTMSTTGHPKTEVFNRLYTELDICGGTILLVLDELDGLESGKDELLYELPRAIAQDRVSNAQPGIIGISNDYQLTESLAPETRDTLFSEEINFAPYSPDHLTTILEDRAEDAFCDGVLNPGVIQNCAAIAGRDSGSARQALRLLYKAGEIARDFDDDADSVTLDHVSRAEYRLERKKLIEGIRTMNSHSHLALCAVIELMLEDREEIRTKDVYQRYNQIADGIGISPLTNRRLFDRLQNLCRYGFLNADMQSTNCQYNTYMLDVQPETALDALADVETDGVSERIEQYRSRAEADNLVSTAAD